MIDLQVMPPNWQFAQKHLKATKPGLIHHKQRQKNHDSLCPCCLKIINKQSIDLSQNCKQLQFLGFGFPLYFIFIKYCIIMLLILITSYNALGLFWAIQHNFSFCSERRLSENSQAHCTSFMIMFSRIQSHITSDEIVIRVGSFFIHLFCLIYIRDKLKKTLEYYDERTTSLSDYSFLIKNLPLKKGVQKGIHDFVNNHFAQKWQELKLNYDGMEFSNREKVMKIILLPNLTQFYKLQEEKKAILNRKRSFLIQKQKQSTINVEKQLFYIERQMLQINKKIDDYCHELKTCIDNDQLQCSSAIVIVNSQFFKEEVLSFSQQNQLNSQIMAPYFQEIQQDIIIQQAPQPKQIIWKNVNVTQKEKIQRVILGWTLSFLFLGCITLLFFYLLQIKTNTLIHALQEDKLGHYQSEKQYKAIAVALVYISLFMIILFNKFIMGQVLHFFAHLEKHQSASSQEFSFAFKYTLGLFFTTALMTLAVQDLKFHNFYDHQYGVIEEQSIMFFLNAIFIQCIWIVNPWNIFKQLKKKWYYGSQYLTQRQANQIMQDCKYTMGKRYAQIIQTMWFTYLYASLIPIGAFLTVIGLSLYYWIDKYNLLRRSSLTQNVSGDMAMFSLKLLDFTLVLRIIGQIIFDYQLREYNQISFFISLTCLILGIVYMIIPIDNIMIFFHDEKFRLQQKSYEAVQYNFIQTYSTLHPVLSRDASKALKIIEMAMNRTFSLNIEAQQIKDNKSEIGLQNWHQKIQKVINEKNYQSKDMEQKDQKSQSGIEREIVDKLKIQKKNRFQRKLVTNSIACEPQNSQINFISRIQGIILQDEQQKSQAPSQVEQQMSNLTSTKQKVVKSTSSRKIKTTR